MTISWLFKPAGAVPQLGDSCGRLNLDLEAPSDRWLETQQWDRNGGGVAEVNAGQGAPTRGEPTEGAARAYWRVEAQILALTPSEVGRVTTDVARAATIALGALANLRKLRGDMERSLNDGGKALRALDSLEDYALAAVFAQLQSSPAGDTEPAQLLLERARPLRANLLNAARLLASFGGFPENALSAIVAGRGHLDTANDLALLGSLFESNWEHIRNKVPFDRALVEEASRLAAELLRALGARRVGEPRDGSAQDWLALRARAFRLLVTAYDELTRAATYLRWHEGDAKAFAPPLHRSRQ
jgi:hypothetical protein